MNLPKIYFLEFGDNSVFLKMQTKFWRFSDFVGAGLPFVWILADIFGLKNWVQILGLGLWVWKGRLFLWSSWPIFLKWYISHIVTRSKSSWNNKNCLHLMFFNYSYFWRDTFHIGFLKTFFCYFDCQKTLQIKTSWSIL